MLLTLYTIGVSMNRDGYAFPGQDKIAAGARTTIRTVQRHIAMAKRDGWIAVQLAGRGGKGWRFSAYRACVPDGLQLEDLDETISDALTAQVGGIEQPERDDSIVSPRYTQGDDKIASPRNDRSDGERHPEMTGRDDNGAAKVTTNDLDGDDNGAHGDDTGDVKVATQLCRTNSGSETPALRTHAFRKRASEEAHNAQSRVESARAADEQEERAKAEKRLDDRIEHVVYEYSLLGIHLGKKQRPEVIGILAKKVRATDAEIDAAIERLKDAGRLPLKPRGTSRLPDIVT